MSEVDERVCSSLVRCGCFVLGVAPIHFLVAFDTLNGHLGAWRYDGPGRFHRLWTLNVCNSNQLSFPNEIWTFSRLYVIIIIEVLKHAGVFENFCAEQQLYACPAGVT